MRVIDRKVEVTEYPQSLIEIPGITIKISESKSSGDLIIYDIRITGELSNATINKGCVIKWKIPNSNIKGVWSSSSDHEKRLRADWEIPQVSSRISVDTPVISAYDHLDNNVITFALSDCINSSLLEASIQEEDGCLHCCITLLSELVEDTKEYTCRLIINKESTPFFKALQSISEFWEYEFEIANIPPKAELPLYSTWYSYHQKFTEEDLLEECRLSKLLGYEGIIVDDGWQTMDDGRGYFYTGDWESERIKDPKLFVHRVHELGMFCMFWFSVPFCGVNSKAYQKFNGKFLTEHHPWAPVFDPRYPDVRTHLVECYKRATGDWGVDGLKLDFIDDFKVYPDTDMTPGGGKDCISVNEGVRRLIDEIKTALYRINPNVLIEFRQKYIGPYLWSLGNMFRAFDCPHDSLTNRIRTTDVRLLSGGAPVHSDMVIWHKNETLESAALQLTNILFSVPQLSVRIGEISEDFKQMIKHYTNYWSLNRDVLLHGSFEPEKPSSNYPVIKAVKDELSIIGVYEDVLVEVQDITQEIHFINGKMTEQIAFEVFESMDNYHVTIYDCLGEEDWQEVLSFEEGIHALEVPANGMIVFRKAMRSI